MPIITGDAGGNTLTGGNGDDVIYGRSALGISGINSTALVTDLNQPVGAAITAADPGFLYVVEKDTGVIWRVSETTGAKSVFLDIANTLFSGGGERGVLGVAFHPNYESNGRFFVYLTDSQGDVQVREFHRSAGNPLVADNASTLVLEVSHPGQSNHNGGWLAFSPVDGDLYIATGDGGGGGDLPNNAQNLNSLLGKILRIDVNGDDFPTDANRNYHVPTSNPFVNAAGADEIWAYGLRNPWRNAFDPRNGDLYIADVGQSNREEIDFHAVTAPGGWNFGWRIMEGTQPYDPSGPPGTPQPGDPSLILPIYDYGRDVGTTVTGGEVYVGANSDFYGHYVFADFGSDALFTLSVVNGASTGASQIGDLVTGDSLSSIVDFVTGSDGALYAIGIGGTIYRLEPISAADGDDTLSGGAGNDALIGDAGNDHLDGGAGIDQAFGGSGDDFIVWDANDDLANLQGGSGTDSLVFTVGAPPTSFGLAAHGFEGAQAQLTDTGANPWATETDFYDPAWRLLQSDVHYDDGTRAQIFLDPTNGFDWASNWTHYDTNGQRDDNVVTGDNGAIAELVLDPSDQFDWLSTWTHYISPGQRDDTVTNFDDGTVAELVVDPTDQFDWSSTWTHYLSSGARDITVSTFDDGTTAQLLLDPTDQYDWDTNWTQFDAQGRTDVNVVVFDDGTHAVLDYDQAGAHDWTTQWWLYDAQGHIIQHVTTNDDGSILTG